MNVALWIIQVLLAALFVFSGGMKLVLPIEKLTTDRWPCRASSSASSASASCWAGSA